MALAKLQHLLTSYNHLSATHTHYCAGSGTTVSLYILLWKVPELKCRAVSIRTCGPVKNWPGPNNRLKLLAQAALITVELSIHLFSDGAPMLPALIIVGPQSSQIE